MEIKDKDILPAADIANDLTDSLIRKGVAVVTAPPGAGKSTLLPLCILQWLDSMHNQDCGDVTPRKIIMLEPRRIAARQIAERMASMIGDSVGGTIGYRVRFESKVSSRTRIEVVTEGVLTRMLIDDPSLEDVAVVIFDEFHERSINTDVALALISETRSVLRDDLKIVVMSATIEAEHVCAYLGAPLIKSEGRCYPVEIVHCEDVPDLFDMPEHVARIIRYAHSKHDGDILAFLQGELEIRRCIELLGNSLGSNTKLCPLYGMLPFDKQREAVMPSESGCRKVVLATPVAETSLTIEGVRVVVDSGLCKKLVYNASTGLGSLQTVRISKDMAEQRSGRAGRMADGVCYRLWSLAAESRMQASRVPEILDADLSSSVLSVAEWGLGDYEKLRWLIPPSSWAVKNAKSLLASLGALENGVITSIGRRMSSIPCDPRIARMLLYSDDSRMKSLACDLAAVLDGRDPMSGDVSVGVDICVRVEKLRRLRRDGKGCSGWDNILKNSFQYHKIIGLKSIDNDIDDLHLCGALLAVAYPERVAKRMVGQHGCFQLASGDVVRLDASDVLASEEWLVAASLNSGRGSGIYGRVFLAASVSLGDLLPIAYSYENVCWDARKAAVTACVEKRVGSLILASNDMSDISRERIYGVIAAAAPKYGLAMFDFNEDVENMQRRISLVSKWHPEMNLPDVGTDKVLASADGWLPLYAQGARSSAELRKIDMSAVIWSMLDYDQQCSVERFAPLYVAVPTGSRIKLDYRQGSDVPVLRVRIQECFGMTDTPKVNDGKVSVLMELLSPGYKPVQLTTDLGSFWKSLYFEVRGELKRRYPKHHWPENPLEAEPTRGIKR